jgi:hypothetical protein
VPSPEISQTHLNIKIGKISNMYCYAVLHKMSSYYYAHSCNIYVGVRRKNKKNKLCSALFLKDPYSPLICTGSAEYVKEQSQECKPRKSLFQG